MLQWSNEMIRLTDLSTKKHIMLSKDSIEINAFIYLFNLYPSTLRGTPLDSSWRLVVRE